MLFFKGIHWIAVLLLCVLLAGKCCSQNLETGVECPKPKIENGKVIGLKEVYKRGEESKFECNDGYFPRGHQRIMCQDDGTWSNNPPFCQKIFCPIPAKPHNGFVHVQNISLPGDAARYECDREYEIEGEAIVNCSHNGTWVPNEVPSCSQIKEIFCPYPAKPHNGFVRVQNISLPGDSARYECDKEYEIEGEAIVNCSHNGTWVPNEVPFCSQIKEISCPYPAKPHNGFVHVQNISFPGDSAKYECDREYEIEGEAIVNCSHNGTWVPNEVPSCSQIKDTSWNKGLVGWIIPGSILSGVFITFLGIYIKKKCCKGRKNQGRNSGDDGDDTLLQQLTFRLKEER